MTGPLRISDGKEASRQRRMRLDAQTTADARAILEEVELRGEEAVRAHAARLGDLGPGDRLFYSASDLAAARDRVPRETVDVLERTAQRIRTFAEAQRRCLLDLTLPIPGGQAGHTCMPVDVAGCYAPGGR